MNERQLLEKRDEASDNEDWRLVEEIDKQLEYLRCSCLLDGSGEGIIKLW